MSCASERCGYGCDCCAARSNEPDLIKRQARCNIYAFYANIVKLTFVEAYSYTLYSYMS